MHAQEEREKREGYDVWLQFTFPILRLAFTIYHTNKIYWMIVGSKIEKAMKMTPITNCEHFLQHNNLRVCNFNHHCSGVLIKKNMEVGSIIITLQRRIRSQTWNGKIQLNILCWDFGFEIRSNLWFFRFKTKNKWIHEYSVHFRWVASLFPFNDVILVLNWILYLWKMLYFTFQFPSFSYSHFHFKFKIVALFHLKIIIIKIIKLNCQ